MYKTSTVFFGVVFLMLSYTVHKSFKVCKVSNPSNRIHKL